MKYLDEFRNADLVKVPEGFSVHRKLERGREKRKSIFASPAERSIDWTTAEELRRAFSLPTPGAHRQAHDRCPAPGQPRSTATSGCPSCAKKGRKGF